jgi:hypothetical protein
MVVCVAYACGQVFRDRWLWSEWLFWAPSWGVALGAAIAALVLWRRRVDGRRVAWSTLMASSVALWSGGRFLMHDVGWAFSMPAATPASPMPTKSISTLFHAPTHSASVAQREAGMSAAMPSGATACPKFWTAVTRP